MDELGGSSTVAAETIADHQYNDDFWHGLDPTKLEKERRSALAQRISDIAAAQSKAVSLARPAKANLHSLVLQSSKLRATL
jgi:hypothetical protein